MTIKEKATLLTGKKNWFFEGVERLGIRDFVVADGPHGLRAYMNIMEDGGYPSTRDSATMFPCASAMASSFNPDLLFKVGETIGKECNHYKVDVILAPGVNGKRSPLAGRNFEYYSEDPVLTGVMGAAFVQGVQSMNVGTSLKHFILNEQETHRRFISSEVDQRTFREIYAYPFEYITKKAKPLTVMPSYNKINGEYACESKSLLSNLIREEWGFEGLLISDWGAVQDKRKSVEAGLDIEMPESEWKDQFVKDCENGKIDEALLDKTCLRILTAYEWMLKNPHYGKQTNFEENHLIAVKIASESICLLKNNDAILPIDKNKRIAILGEYASNPRIGGGGSSDLQPFIIENPLDEILKYTSVFHHQEYLLTPSIKEHLKNMDVCVVFTGTTAEIESEGFDRISLDLPKEQVRFVLDVLEVNANVIVINSSGSAVNTEPFIEQVKGFIQSFFLGSASGKAIAATLFGDLNPSGKLSETFPKDIRNTSSFPYFPGKGTHSYYKEGLFTGYRYFDTFAIEPRFSFGEGLSYTNFDYHNLKVSGNLFEDDFECEVAIDITNTGDVFGKETAMLFVGYPNKNFVHPTKVLKKFKKIGLVPQETKTVTYTLSREDFFVFVEENNQFMVESGEYHIYIGASIQKIHAITTINICSKDEVSKPKQLNYPVAQWLEDSFAGPKLLELEKKYRTLLWWEKEEPLDRILKRIASEYKITSYEYEKILHDLGVTY